MVVLRTEMDAGHYFVNLYLMQSRVWLAVSSLVDGPFMCYKSRRYSGRQKQDIRIDGVLGSIIDGSAMQCFSEWITLGSYFGCGKGTTIGYGEYKVS
jgi:hypothetical protein